MKMFLQTDKGNWALTTQRIMLGALIFPHGAQKLFGWFGGYGYSGTMTFFTEVMHLPSVIAFLVIMGESIGALLLVLGLATRLSALGISLIMLGAIFTSHLPFGFFMNWFGAQKGEGFEYHLLVLALSIPLVFLGGGTASLDSAFTERRS
jgi:putative oxidoreductase